MTLDLFEVTLDVNTEQETHKPYLICCNLQVARQEHYAYEIDDNDKIAISSINDLANATLAALKDIQSKIPNVVEWGSNGIFVGKDDQTVSINFVVDGKAPVASARHCSVL